MAEFLRERGYATAGFIANTSYCAADSGLGRGYTVYRDYIFQELSPFRMAVMVQRSLDGLQAIGDVLGDALDLAWLKAGVTTRPGAVRDRPQGGRGGQPGVPRLAGASPPTGAAVLRLPELFRRALPLPALSAADPPLRRQAERRARVPADPATGGPWTRARSRRRSSRSSSTPMTIASRRSTSKLGRLFDELERRKALDRTWVILVSDHGESFGEHAGVFLHGSSLYQTELHVPLVVVPPPGIRIKPVVAETASLRNLAATIVDIAGWGADSPLSQADRWPGCGNRRRTRPAPPDPARERWPNSSRMRRSLPAGRTRPDGPGRWPR